MMEDTEFTKKIRHILRYGMSERDREAVRVMHEAIQLRSTKRAELLWDLYRMTPEEYDAFRQLPDELCEEDYDE